MSNHPQSPSEPRGALDKKTLKKVIIVGAALAVSLIGGLLLFKFKMTPPQKVTLANGESISSLDSELNRLIKKTREENEFSLRQIDSIQWDQVLLWPEFSDICSLKIDGFSESKGNCQVNREDGASVLIFLNQNKLVAQASVSEDLADFSSANWPLPLAKDKADFVFKDGERSSEIEIKDIFQKTQIKSGDSVVIESED